MEIRELCMILFVLILWEIMDLIGRTFVRWLIIR